MDYEMENEFRSNLSTGEKLLWTGRPQTGLVLRSADLYFIPFSLLWGGFAIFWETSVFVSGAPFFFKLWGIPFVLVGLYLIAGRFFVDARKRAGTLYAISNERIIIKSGIFSREIKSLNIRALSDITMKEKEDGSGTITLGPVDIRYAMMQGMDWPGMKQPPRLEMIGDVKNVYDKIIELQRQK